MATLPNPTPAPYDNLNDVLELFRSRVNDAIQGIDGTVTAVTQPYMQKAVNGAWRRLQGLLAQLGFARLKKTKVLYALPVVAAIPPAVTADPSTQVWMNWTQYFDGYNYFDSTSGPVLPDDFISPLEVRERPSGSGANFFKMDRLINGLPSIPQVYRFWRWQWEDDRLCFPGATGLTDIWIRYAAFLPDFIDEGTALWWQQPVSISRAKDALAWFICAEVAKARGDMDAADFDAKAVAATQQLVDREFMQEHTYLKDSEMSKMRDGFGPGAK